MLYNLKRNDIKNSNSIREVFDRLLKWNNNKDLLLWPLHIQNFDNPQHFKVLYPLCSAFIKDMNVLSFKTNVFSQDSNYEIFLSNYDNNIFLSILYLESISEEYIIIRNGNLKEIKKSFNKDIIIFEVHCKSIKSNGLYGDFQIALENYLESIGG